MDQYVESSAIPQKSARKVTTCGYCHKPGHTKPTCVTMAHDLTLGCSSTPSCSLKRVSEESEGGSKKKKTSTSSITVDDDNSDEETDSNQSGFDEEEDGAVDVLNLLGVYDGGDGYLMNFFMYMGKDEARPPGVSATEYPVHRLLSPVIFHNINLVLATDNWYTSIKLAMFYLDFISISLGPSSRTPKEFQRIKYSRRQARASIAGVSTTVRRWK